LARSVSRPGVRTALLPLLLGLGFFGFSGWLAVQQHLTFYTRARDMGIYLQALWSAGQGRPFITTLLQENTNHLAEHVALALWPLVPLSGLGLDAAPLVLLQQAALALCGWPIYRLARSRLGRWPALAVLAAFYLYPALSRVSLSEFHPVVVAALPAALGVAAALEGRPRSGALLLLFALLMEEELAPTLLGLGVALGLGWFGCRRCGAASTTAIRGGARGLGLTLVVIGLVWALLAVLVVLPSFRYRAGGQRGEAANRAAGHYDQVVQEPDLLGQWLLGERGPDVAATWLLPNGGLALLGPEALAVALPGLAVLFLQDRAGTWAGHWAAPLLPVIWLAVALGLARLARGRALLVGGLGVLALGTAIAYPLDSYFPGGREYEADHYVPGEVERALRRAVDRVPPDASLVATRRVVPHLAWRAELYQFPFTFSAPALRPDLQRQDFYILDLTDSQTRRAIEPSESDSLLEKRPRLHVQRLSSEVLLLTRARPTPPEARSDDFGGAIRLSGLAWERGLEPALTLYWEALRRPEVEPLRRLRLLDARGRQLAEQLGSPLDDLLPVRDWDRGQMVAERVALPAGASAVEVAWLERGGRALPLADGRPELELAAP
jgi:uncharacterized membrane protein